MATNTDTQVTTPDNARVVAGDYNLSAQNHPRKPSDPAINVRAADLEPYVGLRYLSRLFKLMAVVLVLLMVADAITGFVQYGMDAIQPVLAEVSKFVVLAGLLWGSGDIAILLIDIGHDIRATRILMGRMTSHGPHERDVTPRTPETETV